VEKETIVHSTVHLFNYCIYSTLFWKDLEPNINRNLSSWCFFSFRVALCNYIFYLDNAIHKKKWARRKLCLIF